jgi:hypothetical protein
MNEVETGQRRPGVWAKAFAECDGDETKAKVTYLKARVQQQSDAAKALDEQPKTNNQSTFAKVLPDAVTIANVDPRVPELNSPDSADSPPTKFLESQSADGKETANDLHRILFIAVVIGIVLFKVLLLREN